MKRPVLLLLLIMLPILAQAQDLQSATRHYLTTIKVPSATITKILAIQRSSQRRRQGAQLELNVLKAELAKALFPVKVDMKQVRTLLDESLKWKMKAEMASIQQRVEIRQLLGDVKYADYRHFLSTAHHRRASRNPHVARGQ